jgi:predicted DNA-binding transcriptional regulator YafY
MSKQIQFDYVNHRGEKAIRTVTIQGFMEGSTDYYPEKQWLMKAFDHDRNEVRIFAIGKINFNFDGTI